MKKEYSFTEAAPLLQFIDGNREKIIGQHILGYYSSAPFHEMAEGPVAFELDDYSIVIDYRFLSDVVISIVDSHTLKNDMHFPCSYTNPLEESQEKLWADQMTDFPYVGEMITDIQVTRFSEGFEINPSTEERRPDRGDYFSVIKVLLTNGEFIDICAASAEYDGYIEVW